MIHPRNRVHRLPLASAGLVLAAGLTVLSGHSSPSAASPFAPTPVAVQDDPTKEELPQVFVIAPREVIRPLRKAEEALNQRQFAEAVSLLGAALRDAGAEDYFIPHRDGKGTSTSVKTEAMRLIRRLPSQGRSIYELRYGIEAESMLQGAVDALDYAQIAEIARHYFHTQAGYQAMLLLGRHHFDQGRFLQAARCFSQVSNAVPADSPLEPEASILWTSALLYGGRENDAAEALSKLSEKVGRREVEINGTTVAFGGTPSESFQRFTTALGFTSIDDEPNQTLQWTVHRGNPERNGRGDGGLPLLSPLWRVPVNEAIDEEHVVELRRQYRDRKLAVTPSVHPLALGGYVLMRSPDRVIGVDLHSGKRKWIYPWDDDHYAITPDDTMPVGSNARRSQLDQRLWQDAIYGQMSSNGRLLFFVDGLGFATPQRYSPIAGAGQPGRVRAFGARDTNHIVALELIDENGQNVEGKLAWNVGDTDGLDEPSLAGAFFLGPPLPVDGRLYVLAELQAEIRLVALDEATGKLLWSQQLASVEEVGSVNLDGMRRLAGAVPSYADGILVCPTAAGAVVAVDPSTRSLLWGYQFPHRRMAQKTGIIKQSYNEETVPPGEKWTDGSITIIDGRVILTPVESDKGYCLDLETGEPLWSDPLDRKDSLYVATASPNHLVLVGAESISGVSIETGKRTWTAKLNENGVPCGRGFSDGDHYYLPTDASRLLKINVANGQLDRVVECRRPMGNLLSHEGRIISQSYDFLASFHQEEAARRESNELLAARADDPQGLALKGQLLFQEGRWAEAIEAISRSYSIEPNADRRDLFITCLLSGLRNDFAASAAIVQQHESILLDSPLRSDYLRLQVEGLVEQGELAAGFEHLAGLLFENAYSSPTAYPIDQVEKESAQLRKDRWMSLMLERILADADPALEESLLDRLSVLESRALEADSPQILEAYLRFASGRRESPAVSMRFARESLRMGNTREAITEFRGLLDESDDAVAAAACAGLAMAYRESNMPYTAAHYYRELRRRFRDTVCWDGKTGQEVLNELNDDTELAQLIVQLPQWGHGATTIDEGGDVIGNLNFPPQLYPVYPEEINDVDEERFQIDHDQRNNAIVRDRFGREVMRVPLRAAGSGLAYYGSTLHVSRYFQRDGLAVIVAGYDLIGIDLTKAVRDPDGAVAWRVSLLPETVPDPNRSMAKHRVNRRSHSGPLGWNVQFAVDTTFRRLGAVGSLSHDSICYIKQNQLVCIDSRSGEAIWRRNDVSHGSDLLGDGEHVIVIAPNNGTAKMFRQLDGAELGQVDLQSHRNILARYRTSILSYEANDQGIQLSVYDPVKDEVRWATDLPLGTRATRVSDKWFAILEPDGTFTIRHLADGSPFWNTQIEPDPDVQSIRVLETPDRFLLMTNHNAAGTNSATLDDERRTRVIQPSQISELVQGRLYAFDRQMGQMLWPGPAYVDQFGWLTRHTFDVPVIPFIRHHIAQKERGGSARFHTEILMVDRRDGRIMIHKDDIPQTTNVIHVTADPVNRSARLELNNKRFDLQFSDRPRPPAPAAQTGEKSSLSIFVDPATDDIFAPK